MEYRWGNLKYHLSVPELVSLFLYFNHSLISYHRVEFVSSFPEACISDIHIQMKVDSKEGDVREEVGWSLQRISLLIMTKITYDLLC